MAVDPIFINNAFARIGDDEVHYVGQAESRSEIASFPTDYRIGSAIICSEDWSVWILSRNGNTRLWKELDFDTDG